MHANDIAIALGSRGLSPTGPIALIRESRLRVSLNRVWVRHERGRTAARNRLLLVHDKLDDGLLPLDRPAIVHAAPGRGQQCAACGCVLTPKQLVMTVSTGSDKTVYLDADCYQVWDAHRRYHLRTV